MATRADVARLAGVSPSTVTYTLNGDRPIAEETRARVLAAARQLGYRPHALAQGLAGGRSRVIAMVFPSLERGFNDADFEYLLGAADAARELDHRVLLWTADSDDPEDLAQLSSTLLVDGLLLLEVRLEDDRVAFLQRSGTPFALIGRTADPSGLLYSDRDFVTAGRMAVDHLAGLGHRHLALIDSSTHLHEVGMGAVYRGQRAVTRAAAALDLTVQVVNCEPTVEAGRAAFTQLETSSPAVTAVVCLNDEATIGIYQGAQVRGWDIPGDLSVLSLSISRSRSDFFYPPITAIHPPAGQIGASAARALIHHLTGASDGAEQSLWPGELSQRGSTAPPRRRGRGRVRARP